MDRFAAKIPNSLKLMFTKKNGEKTQLVTDLPSDTYTLTQGSWPPQPLSTVVSSPAISHCHQKSKAHEQRQIEQKQVKRRLIIALVICTLFMLGELVEKKIFRYQGNGFRIPDSGKMEIGHGGYLAGSLAVMSDAAHLLADITSFLINLCSLWLSSRPATKRLNFGWYRAEIIGALFSVIVIWIVTGILVYLATQRLIHSDFEIKGLVMVITSSIAVVVNIIMGLTLYQSGHGHSHGAAAYLQHSNEVNHSHQPNASIRTAFIHVVGDFLQSVSVLISALVIFFKPEYKIVDPICTFIFSVLVLVTTINVLRDILLVLMEGAPIGLNYNAVKEEILAVNGVRTLHSLHLWALSMNQIVLSVHVATVDTVDPQQVLKEITRMVHDTFNVHAATIQLEQYLDQEPDCAFCQEPKD